ncbi:YrdB family protein [Deinococcus sonorensis]|uniref:YrdB family protein n=2 Tax=Deinococcus sonorensis TaxID=309891 RepID=A0AAU7UEL6_9DEIO
MMMLAIFAFLSELVAAVGLGVWGWRSSSLLGLQLLAALGLPLVFAVLWGLFVAPRATLPLPSGPRLLLKAVLFLVAGAALGTLAGRWPALVFLLVALGTSLLPDPA